jgi:YD repeat-containing protein
MTGVWEDPGTTPHLNYETDYSYDALGNLKSVTQNGSDATKARTRTFVYDSMSRLTSATNPESGNITYSYDADGNLSSKTSPAPNQPATGTATVTLSYCYDALSRMTSKAYTAQSCPASSPAASYFYDQSSANGLTITNPTGRRTSMSDGSGTTAWSYDPMGRAVTLQRTISGFTRNATYQYNLDGSIALNQIFSTKQSQYTYNGAGRPVSVVDPTASPVFNFVTGRTTRPTEP